MPFSPQIKMYQPKKYRKDELSFAREMIRKYPFATVVLKKDEFLATHVPVLIEEAKDDLLLYTHIANHNPMRKHVKNGEKVLLIFQGPHAYVSSSWYKEKNISTWDYSALHIQVEIKLQTKQELMNSLEKLVTYFEEEQENPLFYSDIPREMLKENLELITGFWCRPFSIKGIGKWHQSFGKEDVKSAVQQLNKSNCPMDSALAKDLKNEHEL